MHILTIRNIFLIRKNLKISLLVLSILTPIYFQKHLLSEVWKDNSDLDKNTIKWEKLEIEKQYGKEIIWKNLENDKTKLSPEKRVIKYKEISKNFDKAIYSFNRSLVFDDFSIGPDVSWLVPPGLKWNSKYKFDASTRGHSRRKKGEEFLGWNSGDAVGQFYYQFLHNKKTSFGINLGMRSIYSGSLSGGQSAIGEGLSLGFRIDRKISATEGFALGAEQLLHFDGLTDTGRDIYFTLSKAIWSNNKESSFPLYLYTFGIATGKMAEGNIKFLCSNLLGGSGTEVSNQRRLCWAPVFSIARVHNKNFSTFFEYNSKFFLFGTSIIPFNKIPLRGTFAVQLSDHIDNYKLKNFEELKWVFRLSLGF